MNLHEQVLAFNNAHPLAIVGLMIENDAIVGLNVSDQDIGAPSRWSVRDASLYQSAIDLWRDDRHLTMQECLIWAVRDHFPADPTYGSSCSV